MEMRVGIYKSKNKSENKIFGKKKKKKTQKINWKVFDDNK